MLYRRILIIAGVLIGVIIIIWAFSSMSCSSSNGNPIKGDFPQVNEATIIIYKNTTCYEETSWWMKTNWATVMGHISDSEAVTIHIPVKNRNAITKICECGKSSTVSVAFNKDRKRAELSRIISSH